MKIIIPVTNSDDAKSNIAASFHNTEFVCIYDLIEGTGEYISAKSFSGSNDLSEEFKSNGIVAIISKQMPPMALKLFADSGFNVFRAKSESIEENIDLFKNDQLESMTAPSFRSSSECTSTCSTCSSVCN